uniref:FANCI helical domain-containing protein n=1 Tax=Panagrolaimus sp. JU765 TaxID=591449 RepID=A0AC34QPB2_9BILA
MLKESQHDAVKNFEAEGTPLENILFEWIMLRIHDAASALNVSTSTSIASMESLTNMACELIYFFLTSNDGDEIGIELKKMWIIARTRAIDAFSMILRYLLTKYETKCVPSLERICEKMEEEDEPNDYARQHTQGLENAVRETPLRTQADNANDPGYNRSFRRISAKILGNIYEQIIPALVAAKHTFDLAKCHYEYQKQMMTSIAIGKKLASMFTSTADVSKMKVFKVMNELAMKHDFGEKWSTLDYFKAMMELLIKSNCSEGWTTELGKITEEIVLMFDANNESPPVYASLKPELKNQFVVLIVQTLTQLYQKVQTIIEIKLGMNDEITDEFMTKICTTMRFITQVAAKVFDIDKSLLEEDEAVITNVVNMLSVLYATMTVVTKRFNVLMNSKIPLDDWESLQILSNLSGNEINTIVNATKGNFGTKKYIVPEKKKKTTKSNDSKMIETKAKRDEKLFSKYEKDLESYAVELILLSEKYGTEDRPLKLPANENRANRDFQLSTTTGTKRKQGPEFLESSSSDSSDSEIEVD